VLRDVTDSLLIPDAVYEEIVVKKGGMPGAAEVAQSAWIQRAALAERSMLDSLPSFLHEGEREAIALATEREAQLLVDEIRADAKRLGHINFVRPILIQMQSSGYRFDRTLLQRFLEQIDEA
jgi:predicted nucleic acid-binding protein